MSEMQFVAKRPHYSVLKTEKGIVLPSLHHALERYFHDAEHIIKSKEMVA
jgi:hypothetical protein